MTGGWLIWVIIGITVIQWIYGKAQEQAELNRAKRERERARETALRTGRGVDITEASRSGGVSESDLQARRQAQLKVLRERQAQQQRTSLPPPTRTAPQRTPAPTPPRPTPQRTAPVRGAPGTVRRTPAPSQPGRTPTPRAPAPRAPSPPRPTPSPAQRYVEPARRESIARTMAAASAAAAAKPKRTLGSLSMQPSEPIAPGDESSFSAVPRSRADWRRAIVASEILAQPVSMREV